MKCVIWLIEWCKQCRVLHAIHACVTVAPSVEGQNSPECPELSLTLVACRSSSLFLFAGFALRPVSRGRRRRRSDGRTVIPPWLVSTLRGTVDGLLMSSFERAF